MPQDMPGESVQAGVAQEGRKAKDGWDKADVIAKVLGSVLIPVGLGVLGFYGNMALQNRTSEESRSSAESAAKLKRQELAMTVLLSGADVPELRQWAAGVFGEAAGLPLNAKTELEYTPLSTALPKQAEPFVANLQGCTLVPVPWRGKFSIGCGHTKDVTMLTPAITQEEADRLLTQDLQDTSDQIAPLIKVKLTGNQRTALIDFAFQMGVHAFATSKLLIKLNAGDHAGVLEEFQHWVHANGVVIPGLFVRRAREVALWDQPDEAAGGTH